MNITEEAIEAAARRPSPYDGMGPEDLRMLAILTAQNGHPATSIRFEDRRARVISPQITEALKIR